MKSIRASALNLAKKCPGQHVLAREHVADTTALRRGTAMHGEAADALRVRTVPEWLEWVVERHPELQSAMERKGGRWVEHPRACILRDVELTGTSDLVVFHDDGKSATVFDWKTGYGSHLPDIALDWQMVAYAVLIHRTTGCAPITVVRVLVDQEREEVLGPLASDDLELAAEALTEIAVAATSTGQRIVGAHCDHCMVRGHCLEYLERAEAMTTALSTARGLEITSHEHALNLLLALDPVKKALEVAEIALRDWVDKNGPIEDELGRKWMNVPRMVDRITDHVATLNALATRMSIECAMSTARTSKSAILAVMSKANIPKSEREEFISCLRQQGAMESKEENRYEWRDVEKKRLRAAG